AGLNQVTLAADESFFELQAGNAPVLQLLDSPARNGHIVRVREVLPGRAQERFLRTAQKLAHLPVDLQQPPVETRQSHAKRRLLKGAAELLFAGEQALFGPPALRHLPLQPDV